MIQCGWLGVMVYDWLRLILIAYVCVLYVAIREMCARDMTLLVISDSADTTQSHSITNTHPQLLTLDPTCQQHSTTSTTHQQSCNIPLNQHTTFHHTPRRPLIINHNISITRTHIQPQSPTHHQWQTIIHTCNDALLPPQSTTRNPNHVQSLALKHTHDISH